MVICTVNTTYSSSAVCCYLVSGKSRFIKLLLKCSISYLPIVSFDYFLQFRDVSSSAFSIWHLRCCGNVLYQLTYQQMNKHQCFTVYHNFSYKLSDVEHCLLWYWKQTPPVLDKYLFQDTRVDGLELHRFPPAPLSCQFYPPAKISEIKQSLCFSVCNTVNTSHLCAHLA